MYDYLIGVSILGGVWAVLYLARKDLRRPMVWSGCLYILYCTVGFIVYRLAVHDVARTITPGYWSPPTLFNLGRRTGGYAIEDALFMFFVGGIAAALYKFFARIEIGKHKVLRPGRGHALWGGALAAVLIYLLTSLNAMYSLIAFNVGGAAALLWQRRDLLRQSLWSGALFTAVYALQFYVFRLLFPNFIGLYYHLQHTSGIKLAAVPFEEYLYAFTFGALWGPIYEYKHQLGNVKLSAKRSPLFWRTAADFLRR